MGSKTFEGWTFPNVNLVVFSFSSVVWHRQPAGSSPTLYRSRLSLSPIHLTYRCSVRSLVPAVRRVVVFVLFPRGWRVVACVHHDVEASYDRRIYSSMHPDRWLPRVVQPVSWDPRGPTSHPHPRPIEISSTLASIVRSRMRFSFLLVSSRSPLRPPTQSPHSSTSHVFVCSFSPFLSLSFRRGVGRVSHPPLSPQSRRWCSVSSG